MSNNTDRIHRRTFLINSTRIAAVATLAPPSLFARRQPSICELSFDAKCALNVMIPGALAAYRVMDHPDDPRLPPGFEKVGLLKADPLRVKEEKERLSPGQARMLDVMVRDSSVFGLVSKNSETKTCLVALRGTKTAKEWLKDFEFVSEPYKYVPGAGDVHKGFQAVYTAVRNSVVANIEAALPGCTRILITGHSLGSALTILAAPDIAKNIKGGIVPELWPFAGPRTGRNDFVKFFDMLIQICYRMDNIWDLVPHLPAAPYQHVHSKSEVSVDGGFTLDIKKAHDLQKSYIPGLQKLIAPTHDN